MPELPLETSETWCNAIAATFRPSSVCVVGRSSDVLITCFLALNIPAASRPVEPVIHSLSASGEPTQYADLLVLDQDVRLDTPALTAETFRQQFGSPRHILVLISCLVGQPSLVDFTHWLDALGYSRVLSEEHWHDSWLFTAVYREKQPGQGPANFEYEAEWWRQSQLNQKRRIALTEYMSEMGEMAMRYDRQISVPAAERQLLLEEIKRQENWSRTLQQEVERLTQAYQELAVENAALREVQARWDAFLNSKFGRLWRVYQHIGAVFMRNRASGSDK